MNRTLKRRLLKLKKIIIHLLIASFLIPTNAAYAANIDIDTSQTGSNGTRMAGTSKGAEVVNISRPSAGGVSKNKFGKYNVGTNGVILNNATTKTNSVLTGEAINANTNFSGNAANIVLFEVTKSNKSTLAGTSEMLGNSADFILANPYGIQVNGAGFINMPRVTLTTGKVNWNGDKLSSFDVRSGEIQIGENGMDASAVSYVDLLSRTVEVNGRILAGGELNIIAGANQINSDGSINNLKYKTKGLSIDANELGSMYAGAVHIVSTDLGAGVNSKGLITALTDDVMITSAGDVTYKDVIAAKNLGVKAGGKLTQDQGTVVVNGHMMLNSDDNLSLTGETVARGSFTAIATDGSITVGQSKAATAEETTYLESGSVQMVADEGVVLQNSTVISDDAANIQSKANITVSSTDIASDSASFKSEKDVSMKSSWVETGSGDILVQANDVFQDDSYLYSGQDVVVLATGEVRQKDSVLDGVSVALQAKSLKNEGESALLGLDTVVARTDDKISNSEDSMIDSLGNMVIQTRSLDNDGWIGAGVSEEAAPEDHEGMILITAETIDNAGEINGLNNVAVQASSSFSNQKKGVVKSYRNLVMMSESVKNDGEISSDDGNIRIEAGKKGLINTGEIAAIGQTSVSSADDLTNKGTITALSGVSVVASKNVVNDGGLVIAHQSAYIGSESADVVNKNDALILATGHAVVVAGDDIQNYGSEIKGESLTIQAGDWLDNDGGKTLARLDAYNGDLVIGATKVSNDGKNAYFTSSKDLIVSTTELINTGTVFSGGDMFVQTQKLDNRNGAFQTDSVATFNFLADGTIDGTFEAGVGLNFQGDTLINQSTLSSDGNIGFYAAKDIQNKGVIEAGNWVELDAGGSILNEDTIASAGGLSLTAKTDIVHDGELIEAGDDAWMEAGQDVISKGSDIAIDGAVFVSAGRDFNLDVTSKTSTEKKKFKQGLTTISKEKTTEVSLYSSEFNVGDMAFIETGRDFNMTGSESNIKGDAYIKTKGDMFLQSGEEKIEVTVDSSKDTFDRNITALSSELTIGKDAFIETGGDLLMEGSNMTIKGNASIQSNGDIGLFSAEETHFYKEKQGKKTHRKTTITQKGSLLKIEGEIADIQAKNDITLMGSTLDSDAQTSLVAGGDINILAAQNTESSKSESKKRGFFQRKKTTKTIDKKTNVGSELNLGDDSIAKAAHDLTIVGSAVSVDGDGTLLAGNDVNILSGQDLYSEVTKKSNKGLSNSSSSKAKSSTTQISSDVEMTGDLVIVSEGTTRINGSSLKSGQELAVSAQGGLEITSATNSKSEVKESESNFLMIGEASKHIENELTQQKSTLEAGGNMTLYSGGDILISGSDLKAENGNIGIQAAGNVNIQSVSESNYVYDYSKTKKLSDVSLSFDDWKLSASISTEGKSEVDEQSFTTQLESLIMAGGDIQVLSGKDAMILGSSLSAGANLSVGGQNIHVLSAEDVQNMMNNSKSIKATLTATVGNSYADTAQSAYQAGKGLSQSVKNTGDAGEYATLNTAAKAIQATLAAAQVAKLVEDTAKSAKTAGSFGFYATVSQTASVKETQTNSNSTTAKASTLSAGGNIALNADNGLTIKGSQVYSANGNIALTGKQIDILAAESKWENSSDYKEYSETSTLFSTAGATKLPTFSKNSQKSSGSGTTHLLSGLNAENGTIYISADGGNISVAGAEVLGKNIQMAALNGQITVKSLQDVMSFKSEGDGIQVGTQLGGHIQRSKTESAWVNAQTKIQGTESVDIQAKTLQNDGALIANITKEDIDGGNLNIVADTLIFNTIKDRYSDSSYYYGAGISNQNGLKQYTKGFATGSTSMQASNSGQKKAQDTNATIGQGVIVTGSDVSGLNRDIALSQKITKDKKSGGLSIDLTIDNQAFLNPTQYFSPLTRVGENSKKAADRLQTAFGDLTNSLSSGSKNKDGVDGLGGALKDYKNITKLREACIQFGGANAKDAEILLNPDKYSPAERDAAMSNFNAYAAAQFGITNAVEVLSYMGSQLKGEGIYATDSNGNVFSKNDANAFYDATGKTIYINNEVQDGSTSQYIKTDGHELGHYIASETGGNNSEAAADRFSDQTWKAFSQEIGFGSLGDLGKYQTAGFNYDYSKGNSAAASVRYADPMAGTLAAVLARYGNPGKEEFGEAAKNLGKEVTFGNYYEGSYTDAGLALNTMLAFSGLDAPKDIANLMYDLQNGDNVSGLQFGLDAIALIPLLGALKVVKPVAKELKISTEEAIVLSKQYIDTSKRSVYVGGEVAVLANPVPKTLARVVPNNSITKASLTLGKTGAEDVFVTAARDIKGLNSTQIANKLSIPHSGTGFRVIEFSTPESGIASPINRSNPGFIGGGRTAGGAREFVIPNQPIPSNAKIRILK